MSVIVRSDLGKTSPGQVRIQVWDRAARGKRATRFWIGCWVAAGVSVIIPIAHFVLVPAFLIAGPVGGWVISTQAASILGGESTCPECNAPLPLAPAADAWPLKDLCSACQRRMTIEKA